MGTNTPLSKVLYGELHWDTLSLHPKIYPDKLKLLQQHLLMRGQALSKDSQAWEQKSVALPPSFGEGQIKVKRAALTPTLPRLSEMDYAVTEMIPKFRLCVYTHTCLKKHTFGHLRTETAFPCIFKRSKVASLPTREL